MAVPGVRLEGDAAAITAGREERVEKAVRLTSAALAAPRGWPLALTTHNATLCWWGGRRAMSTTMHSSLRPLDDCDGDATPGLQSPL